LDIINEVLITLRRIIRAIDIHSKNLSQFEGLTVPQLILLKEIAVVDEISVGELAKSVNLSGATVTSILDRMEKRDLIKRHRGLDDKRKVLIKISGKGSELVSKAPPLLHHRFISEFNKLDDWEQTRILSSLQQVALMMDARDLEVFPVLSIDPLIIQNNEKIRRS